MTDREPRVKRIEIRLTAEEYELARRMAAACGVSVSQVIGDALRAAGSEGVPDDPMARLIGKLNGGRPRDSENHDEMVYSHGNR